MAKREAQSFPQHNSLSKKPRRVRGPQAANSVQFIFHGGVYVVKNTLRGESVFSRILCVKTRGSERNPSCQKRATPFFDKHKTPSAAAEGVLLYCTKCALSCTYSMVTMGITMGLRLVCLNR